MVELLLSDLGAFHGGFNLHAQILLLLISLLPVQVSQRVGAFPGSGGLRGSVQVLAAAARWDRGPSGGFTQPQQAEALEGGFDEEALRRTLCAGSCRSAAGPQLRGSWAGWGSLETGDPPRNDWNGTFSCSYLQE